MKSTATVECPACKKLIPTKAIPKHTSGCHSWSTVVGVPPSKFNWDAHCKRGPYADGLMEGTNYVRCLECAKKGWDARFKRMMDHLKKVHGYDEATYLAKYSNAAVRIASTAQKREGTVQARYGVENVFQADSVKQQSRKTMRQRYGASHPLQALKPRQKMLATNLTRYGSANPFGSAKIKARLKATNILRYGTEFPNQNRGVIARRVGTNMIRYGSPVPQGFGRSGKTSLEDWVDKLALAGVVYTGDRSYWVRCTGQDGFPKNRNPDFVVYSPENLARVLEGAPTNEVRTNKVIEVLGDWWHREEIVGLPRDAYVASRIAEYASARISCLILWESEVKKQPELVLERLAGFLSVGP
jgi:hypothetical protein